MFNLPADYYAVPYGGHKHCGQGIFAGFDISQQPHTGCCPEGGNRAENHIQRKAGAYAVDVCDYAAESEPRYCGGSEKSEHIERFGNSELNRHGCRAGKNEILRVGENRVKRGDKRGKRYEFVFAVHLFSPLVLIWRLCAGQEGLELTAVELIYVKGVILPDFCLKRRLLSRITGVGKGVQRSVKIPLFNKNVVGVIGGNGENAYAAVRQNAGKAGQNPG